MLSLAVPRWKRVTAARIKGGDPRNDQAKKGTTRTPGWTAQRGKRLLSKQRGLHQCTKKGGAPKTPVCEIEGTQGPWRLGRHWLLQVFAATTADVTLYSIEFWLVSSVLVSLLLTVACVGLFVSFVALLDKPVEDTSIVLVLLQSSLRMRVGLHHRLSPQLFKLG